MAIFSCRGQLFISPSAVVRAGGAMSRDQMYLPDAKGTEGSVSSAYRHVERESGSTAPALTHPILTRPTEAALTMMEEETRAFVERNREPVSDALDRLFKEKRFVLVGEHHLSECEPVREALAQLLATLQKEGLTHIALEAPALQQQIIDGMDFSHDNIVDMLKEKHIVPLGWADGNYSLLVMAKRLGLKVVLIDHDDGRPDALRANAAWQNERDEHMMKRLKETVQPDSKVLVFIGSAHVHTREVEGYRDGFVKRLGARLVEEYGNEHVASIRHLNRSGRFDGLPSFMSQSTTPERISTGKEGIYVLPDQGPIKGDPRVSASDYIITTL